MRWGGTPFSANLFFGIKVFVVLFHDVPDGVNFCLAFLVFDIDFHPTRWRSMFSRSGIDRLNKGEFEGIGSKRQCRVGRSDPEWPRLIHCLLAQFM
jgi:hypothetical protein